MRKVRILITALGLSDFLESENMSDTTLLNRSPQYIDLASEWNRY